MNGIVTTYQLKTFKIFYKYAKDKFDVLYIFIDIKNNKKLLNKYIEFINNENEPKSNYKICTINDLKEYYEEEYFKEYYKEYMSTFNKVYFIKYLLDRYYLKNFLLMPRHLLSNFHPHRL